MDRRHELAEQRSLALHRIVAERMKADPSLIEGARARALRWAAQGTLSAGYAERWRRLLDGPREALLRVLVSEEEDAKALRQTTPFTFVVSPRERWRIWKEVRRDWERHR